MIRLSAHDAATADALRQAIADVYRESWADSDDPFRSRDAFLDRYASHTTVPGFRLIAACQGDALVGYIYGYPLPATTRRWESLLDPLPPEYTRETGKRTLGINELHVRPAFRRRGLAHALHDEFLRGQRAERATLLVDPANATARAAYRSWGYTTVGRSQPFPDSPVFDVLVLDLSA